MTQEEKAKAYDKALEIAKAWCKLDNNDLSNEDLETLFPELKESEDERIRKEIINYIKTGTYHKDWIAWLEKQGKQKHAKSIVETWKDMRLEVYQQASGNRHEPNYSDDTTKMFSLNNIDEIIEKMSEQNHADKVEHKFKVGDEIKTTNEEPLTITKIDEKGYWSEDLFICGFDDAAKWELVEQKLADKVGPKFKVKYAGNEYNVLEIKEIAGVTYYGIEDEPNHIDYVLPDNCEIVRDYGFGVKETGSPYPTK